MSPNNTTSSFLSVLEQRPNLGFYPEFGVAGHLLRSSRAAGTNGLRYRFVVNADGHETETHILLPSSVLQGKQLSAEAPALRVDARIFLTREPESDADEIFFVEDMREIVALLRLNLRYLSRRNDKRSDELYRRLTGMSSKVARLSDDLCLELCGMRKESTGHMRDILHRLEGQRAVLEGLDRGELLDIYASFTGSPAEIAESLTPHEVEYLVNVVRARYCWRVHDHMHHNGRDSLTPLGRKIMATETGTSLTLDDKRILLSLALRAYNRPMNATLGSSGGGALVHGSETPTERVNSRKSETKAME